MLYCFITNISINWPIGFYTPTVFQINGNDVPSLNSYIYVSLVSFLLEISL